jgi:hypothetical protein
MIPKYKLHQVVGVKLSDTEEKGDIIGIDIDDKIYYRMSLYGTRIDLIFYLFGYKKNI